MIVVLNLFDVIPGREKSYAEYLRRVQPILDRHGAKVILYGRTRAMHMGSITQEYCGLIGYPGMDQLKALSHDPEFQDIRALRDGSTRNYVMTTIERFDGLGAAVDYLETLPEA